jgi:hypothetical protein
MTIVPKSLLHQNNSDVSFAASTRAPTLSAWGAAMLMLSCSVGCVAAESFGTTINPRHPENQGFVQGSEGLPFNLVWTAPDEKRLCSTVKSLLNRSAEVRKCPADGGSCQIAIEHAVDARPDLSPVWQVLDPIKSAMLIRNGVEVLRINNSEQIREFVETQWSGSNGYRDVAERLRTSGQLRLEEAAFDADRDGMVDRVLRINFEKCPPTVAAATCQTRKVILNAGGSADRSRHWPGEVGAGVTAMFVKSQLYWLEAAPVPSPRDLIHLAPGRMKYLGTPVFVEVLRSKVKNDDDGYSEPTRRLCVLRRGEELK